MTREKIKATHAYTSVSEVLDMFKTKKKKKGRGSIEKEKQTLHYPKERLSRHYEEHREWQNSEIKMNGHISVFEKKEI